MWYLPCGFMSAMCGTRAADPVEVVELELDAGLVGDGEQVQHGVGGATERHDDGDGVLERLLGHDLAGTDVGSSRPMTASPRLERESSRRRSTAGADAYRAAHMPSASATDAIVLAVNMPAQRPASGRRCAR